MRSPARGRGIAASAESILWPMTAVLAIDQGTTSSRFVIVDEAGSFVAMAQMEHQQVLPRPGWVEHDGAEIWANTELVVRDALAAAGLEPEIVSGGTTPTLWRSHEIEGLTGQLLHPQIQVLAELDHPHAVYVQIFAHLSPCAFWFGHDPAGLIRLSRKPGSGING